MNLYFICTGNTCRSPMAEAIIKSKNIQNVEIYSAGIFASDGGSISPNARTVLMQHGIPESHRTSAVNAQKLAEADLVLTMTVSHRNALLEAYPEYADKTFTLKEYVGEKTLDVSDPYGGSVADYEITFKELQHLINALQLKIVED